jgi:S1/P1 Nuclease
MRHLIAVVVAFSIANTASAWNKAGHMVSGAIAYAALKQDNSEVHAKVVQLLKAHPQFADHWSKRLEDAPDGDRDLMLFMLAARWPDDIRDNADYHHSRWHYINMPFKPDGQPDSVVTLPPDPDNIVRAFEQNLAIVASATASDDQKATSLCWIFHLIGDGHQPLHSVSLYTTDFPRGDRGGNSINIRVKSTSASVINLHKFWDDLIIGSENTRAVRNKATELRLRQEFAREQLTELQEKSFENWVKRESFKLAKEVVYRNGLIAGGPDPSQPLVLPEDYIPQAKAVGERRIVLAGYRLSEVLTQALK